MWKIYLDKYEVNEFGDIRNSQTKKILSKRIRINLSAAKDINGSDSHIASCCTFKRKSHKGYKWRYKNTSWAIGSQVDSKSTG